ncbi:MAG: ABC transporter substrate-binding protein [Aquincola sp.]|nr:ABC transporter substrate-binding protein [Aquincola sp.]MDH5328559.1 ABC transporter substrate-binding protein [Aquincola sp.]
MPMCRVLAIFVMLLASPAVLAKPLVYCTDASPEGFDPSLWDSTSTSNVTSQIFNGLLSFERGTTRLQPELATAWRIAPDAKTFTFTLRRGVKFQSTPYFTPAREFNADDVIFTFGRMTDPAHPFHQAFPATYVYAQSLGLAAMIEGIDRIDDHHVRFRLTSPNVTFPTYFAMAFAGIHSAEYAQQLLAQGRATAINNQPVGTGPFKFRSYRKDDVVRLVPHESYWGGVQATTQLIFAISREPAVRVQKMAAGECHVTAPLRDIDLAALDRRREVVILKAQALNISYLAFNLKKRPTDDRRVREALDIAVDRDALFKVLFPRGDAMQAVSAFPPAIAGYNGELKNEFDPARAKTLLAQAGYPGGIAIDLWALPIARPTNPNGLLMAQMIQQDWARIGVKATIKTYEWGEYLKRANNGEHHVYMSGWSGDTGDADDFLAPNLTCAASRGGIKFCNAEFDRLVEQGRATVDPERRNAIYREAQVIFKRERPWITMAHSSIYVPIRRDVKGFVMAPNGRVDFEGVYRE